MMVDGSLVAVQYPTIIISGASSVDVPIDIDVSNKIFNSTWD
jgi:hypothetical protein